MSTGVPATIANQLLNQLEDLFDSDEVPGQFVLAQLKRDALALQKVDAAQGSMALAGIAALKWDFEECRRWVENTVRLDPSVAIISNAAVAYTLFNRYDLAVELLQRCYELAPRDESIVTDYIDKLRNGGHYAEAIKVFQLAKENGLEIEDELADARIFIEHMAAAGISAERVEFELRCAYQVLANHQRRVTGSTQSIFVDPEDVMSFVISICFSGDFADEMRLEAELAELLADEPGWNPCVLSVELKYMVYSDAHQPV